MGCRGLQDSSQGAGGTWAPLLKKLHSLWPCYWSNLARKSGRFPNLVKWGLPLLSRPEEASDSLWNFLAGWQDLLAEATCPQATHPNYGLTVSFPSNSKHLSPSAPLRSALLGPRHPRATLLAGAQKGPNPVLGATSTKGAEAGAERIYTPRQQRGVCLVRCRQTLTANTANSTPGVK